MSRRGHIAVLISTARAIAQGQCEWWDTGAVSVRPFVPLAGSRALSLSLSLPLAEALLAAHNARYEHAYHRSPHV